MKTFFGKLKFPFFILLLTTSVMAQIPNNSMEEWSGDVPTNWLPGNYENYVFVTPVADPHSGSFAARIETKEINSVLIQGIISAGADGSGFPISQRYNQVSLYYKFHKTVSTAYITFSVGVKKGEDGIGAGVVGITTHTDQYVALNIPIHYVTNDIPDRAVITIAITDQTLNTAASGSYVEVDDFSFDFISGVDNANNSPNKFELQQNFPNPFNPSTAIKYSVPETGNVTLKVYDIIGNEVATLVNETKPAGDYEVHFSPANLSSGIYIYRLQAGSQILTRKMTYLK